MSESLSCHAGASSSARRGDERGVHQAQARRLRREPGDHLGAPSALAVEFTLKQVTDFVAADGDRKYFQEKLPEALMSAVDALDKRYDAIIVDEGQDFHGTWWEPVLCQNSAF